MEEKKLTKKQIAEHERVASLRVFAQENGLDEKELIEGIYLLLKHKRIIGRSAKKLSNYVGSNYAPALLGNLVLVLLQLSEYDDPEYLHSAYTALLEIYKQATRDNASPSELFEIMSATSLLESNNNSTIE